MEKDKMKICPTCKNNFAVSGSKFADLIRFCCDDCQAAAKKVLKDWNADARKAEGLRRWDLLTPDSLKTPEKAPKTLRPETLEWNTTAKPVLFIAGPCRAGKTRLAFHLLRPAMEAGETALVCRMAELSLTMSSGDLESAVLSANGMKTVDMLVLDDIAMSMFSDRFSQLLFVVINQRIEAKMPTIITCNCSLKALLTIMQAGSQRFAEPIYARLVENAQTHLMEARK